MITAIVAGDAICSGEISFLPYVWKNDINNMAFVVERMVRRRNPMVLHAHPQAQKTSRGASGGDALQENRFSCMEARRLVVEIFGSCVRRP